MQSDDYDIVLIQSNKYTNMDAKFGIFKLTSSSAIRTRRPTQNRANQQPLAYLRTNV